MSKYFDIEKIDKLTSEIVNLAPGLREFFESNYTIEEYSEKLLTYTPLKIFTKRQKDFSQIINKKIDTLFSSAERKNIQINQWKEDGLKAGVVDHHGILNHPDLFGVNAVVYFSQLFEKEKYGDIVSFATGNVPLDEVFHDRGFKIEGKNIRIFPKKDRNKIVYGQEIHQFNLVKKLEQTKQWYQLSERAQELITQVDNLIKKIDFGTCATLGDQLTKINFYLWPLLFDQEARKSVLNVIPLEYEGLAAQYLIQVWNDDPDSYISRMIFEKKYRDKTLKYFDGTFAAWDNKNKTGTHFFWGLSKENKHKRLEIKNNHLESRDGSIKIPLEKESLSQALIEQKIITGMFIKFSLLLFYMGLKPFAGYGSANYLFILQEQMMNFLSDEYLKETHNIQTLTVNNATSLPVFIKRNKKGEIESYFAFDIMLDGGLNQKYFEQLNTVPVKYFLIPSLNFLYDYTFEKYGSGSKKKIKIKPADYSDLFKDIL